MSRLVCNTNADVTPEQARELAALLRNALAHVPEFDPHDYWQVCGSTQDAIEERYGHSRDGRADWQWDVCSLLKAFVHDSPLTLNREGYAFHAWAERHVPGYRKFSRFEDRCYHYGGSAKSSQKYRWGRWLHEQRVQWLQAMAMYWEGAALLAES